MESQRVIVNVENKSNNTNNVPSHTRVRWVKNESRSCDLVLVHGLIHDPLPGSFWAKIYVWIELFLKS